jgi:hypothetical protein
MPGGLLVFVRWLAEKATAPDRLVNPAHGYNAAVIRLRFGRGLNTCICKQRLMVRFGKIDVQTALAVYAHLFNTDDFADAMAVLGAMETGPQHAENVVPLWG